MDNIQLLNQVLNNQNMINAVSDIPTDSSDAEAWLIVIIAICTMYAIFFIISWFTFYRR